MELSIPQLPFDIPRLPLDIKLGIVSASLIVLVWLRKKRNVRQLPLPPGPPGVRKWPIIGNLLDMPVHFAWITYNKWCRELGTDIIHLEVAGQNIIVLDTPEATTELLEKRSSLYSNRARMPMINELMGWSFNLGFMGYGPYWREHRRLFHLSFHPTAALRFRPHELKATHCLLRNILKRPDDLMMNLRQMAGQTVMRIAYGLELQEENDPYVATAAKGVHPLVAAGVPGAFLVDTLPFLKYVPAWMPGAGFQRKAKEWKELALRMVNAPYDAAKERIADGDTTVSFVSDALERMDPNGDLEKQEYIIKSTAGTMYAAGSDTTVAAISSCVLGLLENPEVLQKAQKEIDEVVGAGQLPTFEHYNDLPYITAITNETLRWRDVVPIAIPHLVDCEDVYKGYRIPAGSIIIPNAWAMLHNPDVYPDPFSFKPDRFMKDGELDPTVRDPAHACFGFGRRICPGRYMAFQAVWIAIASLIAAFDIRKAVDENGNIIEPSHEYASTLVVIPLGYECCLKPRSKEMEDLIRATSTESYD